MYLWHSPATILTTTCNGSVYNHCLHTRLSSNSAYLIRSNFVMYFLDSNLPSANISTLQTRSVTVNQTNPLASFPGTRQCRQQATKILGGWLRIIDLHPLFVFQPYTCAGYYDSKFIDFSFRDWEHTATRSCQLFAIQNTKLGVVRIQS